MLILNTNPAGHFCLKLRVPRRRKILLRSDCQTTNCNLKWELTLLFLGNKNKRNNMNNMNSPHIRDSHRVVDNSLLSVDLSEEVRV